MANLPPDPNSGAAGTEYKTVGALREAGCVVDTVWRNELSHRISHPNLHNLLELLLTSESDKVRRVIKEKIARYQALPGRHLRDERVLS